MPKKSAFSRNLVACWLLSGLLALSPACVQSSPPESTTPRPQPQETQKSAPMGRPKSAPPPEMEPMKQQQEMPAKKSSSDRIGGQTIRKGEDQETP